MPAIYAIGLLIAFYGLAVAEILIPSGGVLGISAIIVAVTSIIIGYTSSLAMAVTLTLIYLITTPILAATLIRLWPKTRLGRRMLNRDTRQTDSTLPEPMASDGTLLSDLVGRIGKTTSNLLPSGEVRIDGHRSDAVSTGLPIDAGTPVVVVRVHLGRLQVRAANSDEIQNSREDVREPSSSPPRLIPDPLPLPTHHEEAAVTSSLDDIDFDQLALDESRSDDDA